MTDNSIDDGEAEEVWSDPPCRLLVRSKTRVELFELPERNNGDDRQQSTKKRTVLVDGVATSMVRLTASSAFAVCYGVGVVKLDLDNPLPTSPDKKPEPFLKGASTTGVQMMDLSPNSTYLLTWERFYEDTCPNNLKLWNANTGNLVGAWPQKNLKREAWPYLQWTHDEQFAFLLCTNEVRVYPVSAFTDGGSDPTSVRYDDKLRIQGISCLSLPSNAASADNTPPIATSYLFTSFCPGNKDKPARASLHEYRKASVPSADNNNSSNYPSKLSKSLFQAEEMKTRWSPNGDAALITLQTSVDASGESYYGSSQLFLLTRLATDVVAVDLEGASSAAQKGPVLAVEWMPNGSKPACFVVVAGKIPAMASLHNGQTGKPLFLFGQAHRNTVSWSPHGRFLLLAGFGNLSGGLSFWDRNKLKLVPHVPANLQGTLRASGTTGYDWSPDSRTVCLSTTSPRLNVDNGIKLFRYTGEQIDPKYLPWDEGAYLPDQLLEAMFVPAPSPQHYPDRPQTPPPAEAIALAKATGGGAAASAASARGGKSNNAAPSSSSADASSGRYVPPSARRGVGGRGGGSSLAERMRREREGAIQGATVVNKNKPTVAKSATGKVIPGLAQDTQAKSKSALKREKAKLKKQQEQAIKEQEEAAVAAAAAAEGEKAKDAEQGGAATSAAGAVDPEKRGRKIKKILKQIEDLKQKDPSGLNEDQKNKMASEEELRSELEQLGL